MGLVLRLILLTFIASFFLVTLSDYMHAVNDALRASYIMQRVTQIHMRELELRTRILER
jgi:hypothetical protein